MRRFDAEYLEDTRRGMWDDSRDALSPLRLDECERVLDVGCGTGELSRVLAEESAGEVVGVDADPSLLAVARESIPVVAGDATRLPFEDDSFDCVVCQALLINLPDPVAALREFRRVARHRVAAVEPDNAAVAVSSTVSVEAPLSRRARRAYLDGVGTDVTLGAVPGLFGTAGLHDVTVRRYDHTLTVEPPYGESAIRAAKRKATGAALDEDRRTMLDGDLSPEEFDVLRSEWRSMGRSVVEAMQEDAYRREETIPFFVTVGTV